MSVHVFSPGSAADVMERVARAVEACLTDEEKQTAHFKLSFRVHKGAVVRDEMAIELRLPHRNLRNP
jgi:hypothetical protein